MEKKATQASEAEGADLGGQLRSAVGRLYRRFRSERPEGGLGDAALDVLTRLHKRGPQTLTELSEHDRVSPASMSQTVNRLTSAGYAVRTGDPDDRRKVLFSATAEGDELASATRAQRNAWLYAAQGTPAMLAYLPALCRILLGEDLLLPSVPTWWCGNPVSLDHVLTNLHRMVIKPTYGAGRFDPIFGEELSATEREQLFAKMRDEGLIWA